MRFSLWVNADIGADWFDSECPAGGGGGGNAGGRAGRACVRRRLGPEGPMLQAWPPRCREEYLNKYCKPVLLRRTTRSRRRAG
ncbi:hypothetical protein Tchl_1430 [Thauera chlorobenzoica]|uniref:Uncharacterized protein n=1 Tax=Thauera chlorobenzoica TaxID=96773 RepID=A0A1L6FBJ6_9RHOO|nr:hypothetical protein Tchl_1430 [Thauera chlorobenzoica]